MFWAGVCNQNNSREGKTVQELSPRLLRRADVANRPPIIDSTPQSVPPPSGEGAFDSFKDRSFLQIYGGTFYGGPAARIAASCLVSDYNKNV